MDGDEIQKFPFLDNSKCESLGEPSHERLQKGWMMSGQKMLFHWIPVPYLTMVISVSPYLCDNY